MLPAVSDAVDGMLTWLFLHGKLQELTGSQPPSNVPSAKAAVKMEFPSTPPRAIMTARFRLSPGWPVIPPLLLGAVAAGIAGALATIGFREALRLAERLLGAPGDSLVELASVLPWYARLALPVLGGLVAGFLLTLAQRRHSSGMADYMEAIVHHDGKMSAGQTLLASASSVCTIASGGSIGREGSMVQLAAMSASLLARIRRADPAIMRVLVTCGAAAGIASAYNAPIASALFVGEIVLGAIVAENFAPIVVAAVVANITMREFPGYHPAYEMPAFPDVHRVELLAFVALGVFAGVLVSPYLRLIDAGKRFMKKSKLPLPLRLACGGLVVGLISVWVPQVWGNGYSVVNSLLHSTWVWSAVLLVLACKVVATAATVGSGAVGGIFTPTIFVGAAIGYLFGLVMQLLWPEAVSPPSTYAVVAMGAFLAGATSAPLMAMLMIFEMTLNYQVMLPLMLACMLAYYVARATGGGAMYEITVSRILEKEAHMRLRGTRMGDLIRPAETVLALEASFAEMTRMFLQFSVKYLYVVAASNRYQGVVALQDLTSAMVDGEPQKSNAADKTAADFLRRDFLRPVTPEMSLDEAMQCFMAHQGERLPVIRSADDPQLLGAVYKTSLLEAYRRLSQ